MICTWLEYLVIGQFVLYTPPTCMAGHFVNTAFFFELIFHFGLISLIAKQCSFEGRNIGLSFNTIVIFPTNRFWNVQ